MTPTSRRRTVEGGFTIVEMLVALTVATVVVAVLANLLLSSSRTEASAKQSSRNSESAFLAATYFDGDVAAATTVEATSPIRRGATGCGAATAALVLTGTGRSTPVQIRSYTVATVDGQTVLQRRTCTGATIAAAVAATAQTQELADVEAGSVVVTCDSDSTVPPGGDAACRRVTLSFTTATGRNLAVEGVVASVATPTPTTVPTPTVAPVTGTCTIVASETTWGATGGNAGASNATHGGDTVMNTYDDTNQRRSFLKFDLTRPCEPGGSWPTLPGGRQIIGVTLQLAYMGHNGADCWIFPGISYDGHELRALDTGSTWTEATLRGDNWPTALRGATYTFNRGNAGNLTNHQNQAITDAVTNWYRGTWVNNGFRLSRSGAGDTCGRASLWASRSNANAALRPRLVITWGTP